MRNPKISKKSVQRLWTKVVLPKLRQQLASKTESLRQATADVAIMADKAKSLIEYHAAPITRHLEAAAKKFQTSDTLEMSSLRYHQQWEALASPLQDQSLLQSGYVYLGRWKLNQMQRVARGFPIEDPACFEMFRAMADTMAMFEVREYVPAVARKASAIASFSNSISLVGGDLEKTPVPVWTIFSSEGAKSAKFGFSYLRTSVVENWNLHDNQGQTILGTLEAVPFNAPDIKDVWLLDAHVTGKLIPLPTSLNEYGLPTIHYGVEPIGGGHVVWSPTAGQFFLVLDTETLEPTLMNVVAYTSKGTNPLHLTPHSEDPSPVTTTTRPEDLSGYTRKVFKAAKRMGDRSVFGAYALGEFEQLQYASEMLKKSWDYEWTPKNLNEFLAAGKPILKNLHQKGAIETANCALANTEFAEAARVFGYKVRLVTGFLGSHEKSIDAPMHMWTEAHVDGHWKELDVTPIGTQPVKERLSGTLLDSVDMLNKVRFHQQWGSVLERLVDPNFQSTSDSLMALANDMQKIPGEMASPQDPRIVVGERHIFDLNMISSNEVQVKMFESRPDRIATKGTYLGGFAITANSQSFIISDVTDALRAFRNHTHLLGVLNDDPTNPVYSIRLGESVALPTIGWEFRKYKATGELSFALQQSKLNELKGELSWDKNDRMVIPGYSHKVFTVCSDLKCVRKEFKLPPTTPDSVLADLLTSLRFITVKADDQDGQTLRYAFSPKAELILKFYDFDDADMGDVSFRFGPMGERLLAIPSAVSTDTHDYENMATKFAALLFAREKGGPVPGEDRHLLKQALHLMLRHPPELKNPLDIVLAAYVMDEARRHQLSETSFVSVTGLSSPQLKACDIMEGCELKVDNASASHPKPLSSVNAILLEIAKRVEGGKKRASLGFDLAPFPPMYRTWFEGYLARNFRKVD